jgi:cytochrome c55X
MRSKATNRRRSPRKPFTFTLVAGLAALTAGAVAFAFGPAGADSDIGPERSKELSYLVRQDCGSCHGMTLKGGLGRPLLPENLAGADTEALAEIILDGIPGTPMPPWRGQLDKEEAMWIARALQRGEIQ